MGASTAMCDGEKRRCPEASNEGGLGTVKMWNSRRRRRKARKKRGRKGSCGCGSWSEKLVEPLARVKNEAGLGLMHRGSDGWCGNREEGAVGEGSVPRREAVVMEGQWEWSEWKGR